MGYVVGGYNLIFATADGGKTWEPWFDRTDNPKLLNLNAIRPAAGGLYITGEGGLVLKLDATAKRFRAVPVDYKGSLFGVADGGDAVLVFGLRGNAFRSTDGGAHWSKVDSQLVASIIAGARTTNGTVLLADQGGRIVASSDGGKTFKRLELAKRDAGHFNRDGRGRQAGADRSDGRGRGRRRGTLTHSADRYRGHSHGRTYRQASKPCRLCATWLTSTRNPATRSSASSSTTDWS